MKLKKLSNQDQGMAIIVVLAIIVIIMCALSFYENYALRKTEKTGVSPFRMTAPQHSEPLSERFSDLTVSAHHLEVAMNETIFLQGALCSILALLIMYIGYKLIFGNKHKGESYYIFSVTALEMDLIRGVDLHLICGQLYTEKSRDILRRVSWDDEVILGQYPASDESVRELRLETEEE